MKKKLQCVLLIDDDEPTNFINKIIVQRSDCTDRIQITESAEDALNYLQQRDKFSYNGGFPLPELIFLDINMPKLNGWDFLQEYREWNRPGKYEPVIVMLTTSMNPEDEKRAKENAEVTGYESKPLSKNKLDELLERHFSSYF
ncbi:MAG TPA: response regulator [Balneolales bacterium]|nr:response regulator [Balneolales bacterium]